jgi:prefoldin subunit 5
MINTASREALEEYATALTATIEELTATIENMRYDLAAVNDALAADEVGRGAAVLCRA